MACINKNTGKPLSAYDTEKEAKESAKYSKKEFKLDLYPYKCEKCGKYHLAPKASKIDVQKNACSCTDTNGKPKALYATKKDAEKQRVKSESEQKVKLYIFKCPEKKGFHLTHHAPEEYKDIPAAKKTTEKKTATKKTTTAKKTTVKKPAEKKAATTKKTTASKKSTAVKKTAAKKAPAAKKTVAKKTTTKKAPAKKTTTKKPVAKKTVTKKTSKK
ncbi:MAG: hypothetical protein MJ184_04410 [Treponema sp.]|uniref:hypothetical protein n=1 Tax=Treponema sp. TaxID=166 RepID=UPI00298E763D|nr:hypothetical protein [Treponema sp.]MCQ2600584.1 hypothetical protein [Treponema sp.]